MKKLKYVGFKQLPYGDSNVDIFESKGKLDKDNVENILKYLSEGVLLAISPTVTFDVLSDSNFIIGASEIYTDGEWYWYSDLIYYVGKYYVSLPILFLEEMKNKNWSCDCDNIDITNIEIG